MSDDNWILQTIQPKSDQLNADDLVSGPVTVTVTAVKRGAEDQPVCIELAGYDGRPYKPCKSMRRVLISLWGERPNEWIGRRLTLYCDPDVKWGGVRAGGIRISHMSNIEKPTVLLLTATRGKRVEFTIQPLAATDDLASRLRNCLELVAKCESLEKLEALETGAKKVFNGDKLKSVQDAVKARTKELAQ